jgi:hypothetical protein
MRFMVMHKVDAKMEAGEPPSQGVIEGMGKFIGRAIKAGIFENGAGLHRSAVRVRLVFDGDKRTVVRGPYEGSNELLAGFVMITATSSDHAIELATRLAGAAGDREIEIGPVVEGWDLHGGTRPANAPFRFLLLRKADRAFEAGAPQPASVRQLLDDWKRDGVLQSAAVLAPSSKGVRNRASAGTRTWIDGPFAESKELVAGFSIINVPSLADAKAFAEDYAAILGDNEVDVRVVAEPSA